MEKIILATRTTKDELSKCIKTLENLCRNSNVIKKIYIISNDDKTYIRKVGNIDCKIIFDPNPNKPTAFNLVINELKKSKKAKYHLFTYSKEVKIENYNLDKMIKAIERNPQKLIVVGYRLRDNILTDQERKIFMNGSYSNNTEGIAYIVPWNTCALWNKKFVYGENKTKLFFDEICEKEGNQLGILEIEINNEIKDTVYQGMEDGLAIAELVTKNKGLKYKIFKNDLFWNIQGNEKRIADHKIKMARKNLVLSTFMNIKGYSIDKLLEAGK